MLPLVHRHFSLTCSHKTPNSTPQGPLLLIENSKNSIRIGAWIINYILLKVGCNRPPMPWLQWWFNWSWAWMSNCTPYKTMDVINYPQPNWTQTMLVKDAPAGIFSRVEHSHIKSPGWRHAIDLANSMSPFRDSAFNQNSVSLNG